MGNSLAKASLCSLWCLGEGLGSGWQRAVGQAGHWGLYLGFPSFWALCVRAWACVGVCGHVSVEVIPLNFLLKCQPARCWWGVNTPIDRLLFCLCCCPSGASWPSVAGGSSTAHSPLHGSQQSRESSLCFWEQPGVWGSNLSVFQEGWVGLSRRVRCSHVIFV